MILQEWGMAITNAFTGVWGGVATVVPKLLVAIVIFVVGWIVGTLVGKIIAHLIRSVKLDNALDQAGFGAVVKRAGLNLDSGAFIGGLVKWFVIAAFLVASFEVLGLYQVNEFFRAQVVPYLGKVVVVMIVLLVSIVLADVVQRVISHSVRAVNMRSANFLGALAKWAIWISAFVIALQQLGIANEFISTLYTGVVFALSLAAGLAFGLGGQDAAARFIEKTRNEIKDHQ